MDVLVNPYKLILTINLRNIRLGGLRMINSKQHRSSSDTIRFTRLWS